MGIKLYDVQLHAGDDRTKTVLATDRVDAMREMGFKITECEDQGMMSVIALRNVKQLTGHQIILKSGESVINLVVAPTQVSVVLSVVTSREKGMFIEITGLGTRLYSFTYSENTNSWLPIKPITVWAEGFEPQLMRIAGQSITPTEYVEKLWFARECHRPGTSANPMDSFERTLDGYTTNTVQRHWKVAVPRPGEAQIAYEAGQYVGEE